LQTIRLFISEWNERYVVSDTTGFSSYASNNVVLRLNKIVNISQDDVTLIKTLYLSKQYGARRVLSELFDKGRKLGSVDSQLKRSHKTGTMSHNQAALDHVRCTAVEYLVLSQEDKPKRHRSAREICMKLPFSILLYTGK